MHLIMTKQTRYDGRTLRPNDPAPADLDGRTAQRWVANGIARIREPEPALLQVQDDRKEDFGANAEPAASPYASRLYAELIALAKEREIPLPTARPKKTDVIAALEADDVLRQTREERDEDGSEAADNDAGETGSADEHEAGDLSIGGHDGQTAPPADGKKN